MSWFLLDRLFQSAVGGLVLVVFALAIGRIAPIHTGIKLWACRIVFLKLLVGLLWSFEVPIQGQAVRGGAATQSVEGWILIGIWIAGVCVVANAAIRALLHAKRLHVMASPTGDAIIASMATRFRLHRLEIRELAGISDPCVVGILKPTLLLPIGERTDSAVLAHELAHIRHRDLAWNAVSWAVFALFWFVPGLGRLLRESALWQESLADEFARRVTEIAPIIQARTLIRAIERSPTRSWAVADFGGDASSVRRRIIAMYVPRFSAPIGIGVVLALSALAAPIRLSIVGSGTVPSRAKATELWQMTGESNFAPIASRVN